MPTLGAEDVYALAPYAKTLGVVFDEMTPAAFGPRWHTIIRSPPWAAASMEAR